MGHSAPRRIFATALNTLVWCLSAGVLFQNYSLSRKLELAQKSSTGVHVGTRLHNISGAGLDGQLRSIAIPETESDHLLILTLSPGCPACESNQANWLLLADELRRRVGWRVLWISRDPIDVSKEYFERTNTPLAEALADPPNRTYSQLHLQAVPSTLVVGAGGIVEQCWTGLLSPTDWGIIYSYLGVHKAHMSSGQVPPAGTFLEARRLIGIHL